jgi:hypothetical protein
LDMSRLVGLQTEEFQGRESSARPFVLRIAERVLLLL